jgi:hypothetical protein
MKSPVIPNPALQQERELPGAGAKNVSRIRRSFTPFRMTGCEYEDPSLGSG